MSQNLNYKTNDSWCYEDKNSNCTKYGRLYTWDAARNVCPDGWRLPSDKEWGNLRELYGGGESAYSALMQGGSSGFSALLGGYRSSDGDFRNLGRNGYYWSSTESSDSHAWYYGFRSKGLRRGNYNKSWAFSCRCLQD